MYEIVEADNYSELKTLCQALCKAHTDENSNNYISLGGMTTKGTKIHQSVYLGTKG